MRESLPAKSRRIRLKTQSICKQWSWSRNCFVPLHSDPTAMPMMKLKNETTKRRMLSPLIVMGIHKIWLEWYRRQQYYTSSFYKLCRAFQQSRRCTIVCRGKQKDRGNFCWLGVKCGSLKSFCNFEWWKDNQEIPLPKRLCQTIWLYVLIAYLLF